VNVHVSRPFGLQSVVAELALRGAKRFAFAHAGGLELIRTFADVKRKLAIEIPLKPSGAENVPASR
jgi:hypothetical protein